MRLFSGLHVCMCMYLYICATPPSHTHNPTHECGVVCVCSTEDTVGNSICEPSRRGSGGPRPATRTHQQLLTAFSLSLKSSDGAQHSYWTEVEVCTQMPGTLAGSQWPYCLSGSQTPSANQSTPSQDFCHMPWATAESASTSAVTSASGKLGLSVAGQLLRKRLFFSFSSDPS